MAITTYAQLKTAVQNWLDRDDDDDLSSRAEDFITVGEAKLNRKLRLREQKQLSTASYPTTNTTRRLAIPTDMQEMISMQIKKASEDDEYYTPLIFKAPDDMPNVVSTGTGEPKYFALRDELEFDILPDVNYTVRMFYLKAWDIATSGSNWLLTNYPDLYLYASLVAAEGYLKNDPRVVLWKAQLDEGIAEANLKSHLSDDMVEKEMDSRVYGMRGTSRYDINYDS